MRYMKKLPSISIVIPVYNSEKFLPLCLSSIEKQDYPKNKIEIIVIDGGSKDKTIEIARKFKVNKILFNPLRTGEAGKAVGAKTAKNKIIAFIDSDNILPSKGWLKKMVKPFEDREIIGTEPLYYTYRVEDGYITRYCALMGMNDPLCLFIGNYDRYCLLTGRWTDLDIKQEDRGDFIKIELSEREIPTIGANGFLIKRELLNKCLIGDYLFDIDIVYELVKQKYNKLAKVKVGIVHIFSDSILTFAKKQRRRIKDYACYKKLGLRRYPWSSFHKGKVLKFASYTLFTLPLLAQATEGYIKKPDKAWFFHVPACWITSVIYGFGLLNMFIQRKPECGENLKVTKNHFFGRLKEVVKLSAGVNGPSLNIGCKETRLGDINVDVDANVKPDLVADVLDLPFKEKTFNLVYFTDVIKHLPKNTELKALAEIHRVLKNGGMLILSTPNDRLLYTYLDPAKYVTGHRHYKVETIQEFVEKSGFEIEKIFTAGGNWEVINILWYCFITYPLKKIGINLPIPEFLLKMSDVEHNQIRENGGYTIFVKAKKLG